MESENCWKSVGGDPVSLVNAGWPVSLVRQISSLSVYTRPSLLMPDAHYEKSSFVSVFSALLVRQWIHARQCRLCLLFSVLAVCGMVLGVWHAPIDEVLLDEKAAKLHIPALIAVPRNLSERELCTCRSFHELPVKLSMPQPGGYHRRFEH